MTTPPPIPSFQPVLSTPSSIVPARTTASIRETSLVSSYLNGPLTERFVVLDQLQNLYSPWLTRGGIGGLRQVLSERRQLMDWVFSSEQMGDFAQASQTGESQLAMPAYVNIMGDYPLPAAVRVEDRGTHLSHLRFLNAGSAEFYARISDLIYIQGIVHPEGLAQCHDLFASGQMKGAYHLLSCTEGYLPDYCYEPIVAAHQRGMTHILARVIRKTAITSAMPRYAIEQIIPSLPKESGDLVNYGETLLRASDEASKPKDPV